MSAWLLEPVAAPTWWDGTPKLVDVELVTESEPRTRRTVKENLESHHDAAPGGWLPMAFLPGMEEKRLPTLDEIERSWS